jgi:predicted DNA-binding ribbon-helix-helix protein
MANTKQPQNSQEMLPGQSYTANALRPPSGVRQDKYAPKSVRITSTQPVTLKNTARTPQMNTQSQRTQKRSTKRKTVQVAGWISPQLKAELERIAEQEKLSLSKTVATILEEGVRQKLHIQHAILLQPIIETTIRREMHAYSSRLAILLVRSLFASEQTRIIATNILGRQAGVTQPVLETILNGSSNVAKRNIKHVSPQLSGLVEEIKRWVEEETKPI